MALSFPSLKVLLARRMALGATCLLPGPLQGSLGSSQCKHDLHGAPNNQGPHSHDYPERPLGHSVHLDLGLS